MPRDSQMLATCYSPNSALSRASVGHVARLRQSTARKSLLINSSAKSRDANKRCHWLQQFCLMNIFQHVGKPAIIAAYCMQKLHAIIAHETTSKIIVQLF